MSAAASVGVSDLAYQKANTEYVLRQWFLISVRLSDKSLALSVCTLVLEGFVPCQTGGEESSHGFKLYVERSGICKSPSVGLVGTDSTAEIAF